MADHPRRIPGEIQIAAALDELLQRIGEHGRVAAADEILRKHARGVGQAVIGTRLNRIHRGAYIEVVELGAGQGLAVFGVHDHECSVLQ